MIITYDGHTPSYIYLLMESLFQIFFNSEVQQVS